MGNLMIYGAYGYTGGLVAAAAKRAGMSPVLAGRDPERLRAAAEQHGFRWRAFPLDEHAADHLADVTTVLNCAGPFSRTASAMVSACLDAKAHYLDITGEIGVFEALHAQGSAARAAGIVLLPGAGFDVVPSDCLAAHVRRRLPGATALELVIGGLSDLSRGTARTGLESVAEGTKVRRSGTIVTLPQAPRRTADLGAGLSPTIGVSWGDVATAYYSTGIPDIDVYFESTAELERMATLPAALKWLLGTRLGQWFGNKAIDRMSAGPGAAARETGRARILAEARDASGASVTSELSTPEPYHLTALTALEAARRIDRGEISAGYHTPSTAFGPDFILGFSGVTRRNVG